MLQVMYSFFSCTIIFTTRIGRGYSQKDWVGGVRLAYQICDLFMNLTKNVISYL